MTDKTLTVVDFVTREQYIEEECPELVESYTATSNIPIPRYGEHIDFGWHEQGGERIERVHFTNRDVEYVKSQTYKVLDIDRHYHQSVKTNDSGSVVEDRIECNVTVIVSEVDE